MLTLYPCSIDKLHGLLSSKVGIKKKIHIYYADHFYIEKNSILFTESAPSPIQFIGRNVRLYVCSCVCHLALQFLPDQRGAGLHQGFQFVYIRSFVCLFVRSRSQSLLLHSHYTSDPQYFYRL